MQNSSLNALSAALLDDCDQTSLTKEKEIILTCRKIGQKKIKKWRNKAVTWHRIDLEVHNSTIYYLHLHKK